MLSYKQYLDTVYAAWLGKLIGIRLGAPVEGWSSEKIEEEYHGKSGYLTDYGIFASDDDANGPLFFAGALKQGMCAQDVGEQILGCLQEYSGFFWWGGVGVSSEHTAYENLKRGIKAPLSGSAETNGKAIAEQIGGQIFSDCWAYVSLDDVKEAVRLAKLASSVTHDLDGVEGAAFVAAAIVLAQKIRDPIRLIDTALTYVDQSSHYFEVARIVENYYLSDQSDWHSCLKFIQDNYGYDKYPGVCHIIPNMAVMVMALCYGDSDFSKTLTIANQAGWDTDCNCGNLGSIMGAMVGIAGIDPAWITPINDIINSSSCLGYRNIDTVSNTAKYFTDLSFEYRGLKCEETSLFHLPYATSGFFGEKLRVADEKLYVAETKRLFKYAYYLGKDIYDARYDPCFSPTVYPGDSLEFEVAGNGCLRAFVEDLEGEVYYGETVELKGNVDTKVSVKVPTGLNMTVHTFGLECFTETFDYVVSDHRVCHHPLVNIDFAGLSYDEYGPRYAGDTLSNIRGFVVHSGSFRLNGEGLEMKCSDHALISSGYPCTVKGMSVTASNAGFGIVFGMKDALHYSVLFVSDRAAILFERNKEWKYIDKVEHPFCGEISISLSFDDELIEVKINDEKYQLMGAKHSGIFGICADGEAEVVIKALSVC